MKLRYLLLLAGIVFAVACNKDKFTTTPQVKIKSISPKNVFTGDIINVVGNYTDQEGDLDSVFVIYKWFNGATEILPLDTLRYSYDDIGVPLKTKEAEIILRLQYNNSDPNGISKLPGLVRDTSAAFGIILLDKMKNRSDYAESEKIRIHK